MSEAPMPSGLLEEMVDDMWAARCAHYGEAGTTCPDDERLDLMIAYAQAAFESTLRFRSSNGAIPSVSPSVRNV